MSDPKVSSVGYPALPDVGDNGYLLSANQSQDVVVISLLTMKASMSGDLMMRDLEGGNNVDVEVDV